MTIIIVLDYEQSHLFGEVRCASKNMSGKMILAHHLEL